MHHLRPRTATTLLASTLVLSAAGLAVGPAGVAGTATAATAAPRTLGPTATDPATRAGTKVSRTGAAARVVRAEAAARAVRTGAASAATTAFASRVTANSRRVVDSAGRVWEPLPATLGSTKVSTRLAGVDVARTTDDVLYRANVWGTPGYVLPVPAPGRYTVRLHLVEDTFAQAGRRVFDVLAEGRTVASRLDIAKAVGKGAAHTVTFPVTVTDGRLDLAFVKRVDQPAVSAVEVTGSAPASATGPTHVLKLAPNNVFQQRVDTAPLAPNSAATAALVRRQVTENWNGVAAVNAYHYNVGFHTAPKGTRRITLGYHNCQRKTGTPRGLFDGPKHFVDVPVPAGAAPAVGTDGEMTIYDPSTDRMWDLWQMRRNARTGAWEACWGGRMDGVSRQRRLAFPEYFGTAASGLSLAAGMVSVDDVLRGRIDHAVAITVIDAARWDRLSWPAVRSDGLSTHPDAVREGQRLRLDPRVDVEALDLTPFGRLVARAAQEYGFIVVDKAGAVAVQTEFGLTKKLGGKDAWNWLLGGPAHTALSNFPWERLQALPVDHGRP